MTISAEIKGFQDRTGKELIVGKRAWRYYRLGSGNPVLWLTGGLRRAAPAFAFLEQLAARHTVIAPDYPPVTTLAEFMTAFDAILQAEGVDVFALAGQSYGGMLAQAYLAHRGKAVERLVISSAGPADYSRGWLPVEYGLIGLLRRLPERTVRNLLTRKLLPLFTLPEPDRAEWAAAIKAIMQNEVSRADMVSHFTVTADLIRQQFVTPAAFQDWKGRIVVLSAENDPTRSERRLSHFKALYGRPVEVVSMGDMGHTALLFNPDQFVALLEQALP